MYGPEFEFAGEPVGLFKDGIVPTSDGLYRYEPYRGPGHLHLHEQLKRVGCAQCNFLHKGSIVSFIVLGCPEYGVLDLSSISAALLMGSTMAFRTDDQQSVLTASHRFAVRPLLTTKLGILSMKRISAALAVLTAGCSPLAPYSQTVVGSLVGPLQMSLFASLSHPLAMASRVPPPLPRPSQIKKASSCFPPNTHRVGRRTLLCSSSVMSCAFNSVPVGRPLGNSIQVQPFATLLCGARSIKTRRWSVSPNPPSPSFPGPCA